MEKSQWQSLTLRENNSDLPREIGTSELILLAIGSILFLIVGGLQ